jgi:Domain of unknown function (DUF1707)
MPTEPSSSSALRESDVDRDRGIELLHAAVADGRFDPAEFERAAGAPRYPDSPSARLVAAENARWVRVGQLRAAACA